MKKRKKKIRKAIIKDMENKIKIGVLVENKNKLLLIKELNSKDGKYYWNVVKGTFEQEKDKDFIQTAKRECKEEIGVSVKINSLQGVMYLHRKNVTQFNFLASIQKGTPKIAKIEDQDERGENIIELRFFSRNEIKNMKKKEFMNERAFLATRNWLKSIINNLDILSFM
jgi:ADP-ribose pyrophosphatase YjhB (NUDIX family)